MNSQFCFVRVNRRHIRIDFDQLTYIEARGTYTSAHIQGGESFLIHMPLKKWELLLPANFFFRINKSVIVNLAKVISFSFETAWISDRQFAISRETRHHLLDNPFVCNDSSLSIAKSSSMENETPDVLGRRAYN